MRTRHFHVENPTTTRFRRPQESGFTGAPWLGRTLLIAGLLIGALALVPADRSVASVAPSVAPAVASGGIGPIADLIGDLLDTLEDVEDELDAVATTVGGSSGPLQGSALDELGDALDFVEAVIDDIFDEAVYPSLEPGDAGTADTSVDPSTLPDYATECLFEIRAALQSLVVTPSVDDEYVGSRLKTILHLLPGFREEAGL